MGYVGVKTLCRITDVHADGKNLHTLRSCLPFNTQVPWGRILQGEQLPRHRQQRLRIRQVCVVLDPCRLPQYELVVFREHRCLSGSTSFSLLPGCENKTIPSRALDRFSKAAVFEDNGSNFDGASGCSVTNADSTGRVM